MTTSYVSIDTVLQEYLDISGEESLDSSYYGGVKEELILKWAHDALERVHTDRQHCHRIALLRVENYKAELPLGFKYIAQAACRVDPQEPCLREEIVEWTQKSLCDTGCSYTISKECPKCHETNCDCNLIVEVDANRIYQDSRPELYTQYMSHFYRHGGLNKRGMRSQYHPDFYLMRKTSNNFFNVPYHIGNCLNLNLDTRIEYDIDHPYIIVNFEKGEILLSYISDRTDENGYRLVPDLPTVHEAIAIYVDEKMAYRRWRREGGSTNRVDWRELRSLREQAIARARSQLQIPDQDEFKQYMDNHWRKLIPYWDYDRNLGRFQVDKFNYGKYYSTNSSNRFYGHTDSNRYR